MTDDTTRCARCANAIPDPVQQFGSHRRPVCAHCWFTAGSAPLTTHDRAIADIERARDRVTADMFCQE